MALVITEIELYEPHFDENTGKYIDKCPYKPYQRNRIQYECKCDLSKCIKDKQSFNSHIKCKSHQSFLENYEKYFKDVDEYKTLLKNSKIDFDRLKKKYRSKKISLKNEIISLKNEIEKKNKIIAEFESQLIMEDDKYKEIINY